VSWASNCVAVYVFSFCKHPFPPGGLPSLPRSSRFPLGPHSPRGFWVPGFVCSELFSLFFSPGPLSDVFPWLLCPFDPFTDFYFLSPVIVVLPRPSVGDQLVFPSSALSYPSTSILHAEWSRFHPTLLPGVECFFHILSPGNYRTFSQNSTHPRTISPPPSSQPDAPASRQYVFLQEW